MCESGVVMGCKEEQEWGCWQELAEFLRGECKSTIE